MKEKLEQQYEDLLTELVEFKSLNNTLNGAKVITDNTIESSTNLLKSFKDKVDNYESSLRTILESFNTNKVSLDEELTKQKQLSQKYSDLFENVKKEVEETFTELKDKFKENQQTLDLFKEDFSNSNKTLISEKLGETQVVLNDKFEELKSIQSQLSHQVSDLNSSFKDTL